MSVGDALGAQFFVVGRSLPELVADRSPAGRWEWTDDTEMACTIVAKLREHGDIEQDRLAAQFADRREPCRDYGAGAVVILHEVRAGLPWRQAAGSAFGGQGSCGNGAMWVAPLGAYHADQPRRAARQALASAEVTHAHSEGIVGAVAERAANAAAARLSGTRPPAVEMLDQLSPYLIDGQVQRGIGWARRLLRAGVGVAEAAYELGNGSRVRAAKSRAFSTQGRCRSLRRHAGHGGVGVRSWSGGVWLPDLRSDRDRRRHGDSAVGRSAGAGRQGGRRARAADPSGSVRY
ncbi:ADP-ribosylglycohydrolase family protein [Phytohabitans flavus]|uniref:ADP-ribosylglycohydrolase family protein n=1 Tax=Phytohabitans flavus TaxID=1076124 RepID=UPI0036377480